MALVQGQRFGVRGKHQASHYGTMHMTHWLMDRTGQNGPSQDGRKT